jgi:ABC-type multidrug transport system fused ATPase/permease subunit
VIAPSPGEGMSILVRLLGFAYRYRGYTIAGYLCLLLTIALGLLQPMIFREVIDVGIGQRDPDHLLAMALALVVVNVISSVAGFGHSYFNEYVSQRVAYDIRNALYDHLQRLSFAYHDRARTGELMSRVTSDVEHSRVFVGNGVLQIVNTTILYVAILSIMVSLNWWLSLVSLATLPFIAVTAIMYGRRVHPMFRRVQRQWAHLTAVLQENITGVRVVKAFAREQFEVTKFEEENQAFLERQVATSRLQAFVFPMMVFISSIGTVAILWFGGIEAIEGRLSVGSLIAFNSYLMRLAGPTRQFGWIVAWVSRATASGERLFEILDAPSPVRESPGVIARPSIDGAVTFESVSFSYAQAIAAVFARPDVSPNPAAALEPGMRRRDRDDRTLLTKSSVPATPILSEISLVAEPDQVVAIVGHTGAGKSTLTSLIPRFYDATTGTVRVDGTPVRDYRLVDLRRRIGIVMQETLLFSASVSENIAFGNADASMESIERAARAAQAYDFIQDLPFGFDTRIGERGVTLSGGQRQRLAIARALLIDPRILILDDATASVDMRTEYQIQEALKVVMQGRTTFIIAQRISTITHADQIIVLDHGVIVQRGTHDSLLAIPGYYRDTYDMQLRDRNEGAEALVESAGVSGRGFGDDRQ